MQLAGALETRLRRKIGGNSYQLLILPRDALFGLTP